MRTRQTWEQIQQIRKRVFTSELKLSDTEWEVLLRRLSASEVPDSEIGSAIVHLSKPLDRQRVAAAKDTVLSYLNHQNAWARHEALWFIRWAGLLEEKSALIHALNNDPDPDNRGHAALCIEQMLRGTSDREAVDALKVKVQDAAEDAAVRYIAYGALIEVATDRSGSEFYTGTENLDNVDWAWVSKLA